jgi:hypothetical protein
MTPNKPLEFKFAEPFPARILIEEELRSLETLSDLLMYFVETQPRDSVYLNNVNMDAFKKIALTIQNRVNEMTIDYNGEKYIIMAKGRRRLSLGFKKEPDLYIGSDYGTNFIEACKGYFTFHTDRDKFNEKKLTYYGRSLFGVQANDISDFEIGINRKDIGYCAWFTLLNQTYNLAPQDKEDAQLQCKLLTRTFENLIAIKKTKPQQSTVI